MRVYRGDSVSDCVQLGDDTDDEASMDCGGYPVSSVSISGWQHGEVRLSLDQ